MQKLNEEFNGKLSLAIKIFNNTHPKKFLHQLVSSQLDMDRLDYLERDSFFSGVVEGNIGTERIISMLNVVMEAYVNRDLKKAHDAREADQEINDKTDALFRELLTYMMENPRNIEACTHLLFISKNLERSGDQVTNIAEQVHYLVTGDLLEE